MSVLRTVQGQIDVEPIRQLLKNTTSTLLSDVEHQLDTALRVRHDIWVLFLEMRLAQLETVELVTDLDAGKLSPDIVFRDTDKEKMHICEVTFTLNTDILDEKRQKYSHLVDHVWLSSPINDEFEIEWLPDVLTVKKRYVAETNSLFRSYNIEMDRAGVDSFALHEYQFLRHNDNVAEPIRWPRVKNKKVSVKSLADTLRSQIHDQETDSLDLLETAASRVAEMMARDDVRTHYSLERTYSGIFTQAFTQVKDACAHEFQTTTKYKPTFLFYAPMNKDKSLPFKFQTEQELILEQIKCISGTKTEIADLVKDIPSLMTDQEEWNIFCGGVPSTDQTEAEVRDAFKASQDARDQAEREAWKYRKGDATQESSDRDKSDFLAFAQKHLLGRVTPRLYSCRQRKCIRLPCSDRKLDPSTHAYIAKSRTGMSGAEYIQQKLEKAEEVRTSGAMRPSISPDFYQNEMEDFFEIASRETTAPDVPTCYENMHYAPGVDNKIFSEMKDKTLDDMIVYTGILGRTGMLRHSSTQKSNLEQLLHTQNFTLKKGYYSFFNSGSPELLYIVQHGHQNKGRDVGRAFMIVAFGDITDLTKKLYGFTKSVRSSTKGKKIMVSTTTWRRLPSQRIAFHADQMYSAYMTTCAYYFRRLDSYRSGAIDWKTLCDEVRRTFATRLTVSLCHSQSTAELLSDIRYLYMDAFSTHASVSEFARDKFVRQIRTAMDAHLVCLLPKFDKTKKEFEKGGVRLSVLEYTGGRRNDKTTGGQIRMTSVLHSKTQIRNIQDLLDDMFLYVHTNKEPSSAYHEFVKAFKTIIKFQMIHDSHSDKEKMGKMDTADEMAQFLLRDDKVGFWDVATHLAGMAISRKVSKESIEIKIDRVIRSDTILDMSSTKSIIPERPRLQTVIDTGDRDMLPKKKKALWEIIGEESAPFQNTTYTERLGRSDSLVVLGGTNRTKVHDSTIDLLARFRVHRSIDIARWNIEQNGSKVLTDICIKAQYGAKREFYVINHGAKAMARVLEKGYRVVCEALEEEMISVSGDRKMYNIQTLLDKAMLSSGKSAKSVYFCNGDCTKWSAAETMECLTVFNNSLEDVMGKDFSKYSGHVLEAWSKKVIEIPQDLKKNVFFEKQGVTTLLREGTFSSTQNFLQGMFNYLSSAKAVGCSELLRSIWQINNPDSTLTFYHMEHSDDYAFVVLCDNVDEFEEFKLMHRIIMRLCGINDSTKKTNCQQFLLEFISLLSFNGMMTYPHIKKIKETGLNIGCLGYAADIQTTCSRVGEAVRVGIPLTVAYVMQRVQNTRIAEAYGLFSANKVVENGKKIADIPTELWGVPDCWPVLYTLTKGDPNSYRLSKFGQSETVEAIDKLFWLKQSEGLLGDGEIDDISYTNVSTLYHPGYAYLSKSPLLTRIRKICGYTIDKATAYWNKHFFDLYLKPKDTARFSDWLYSKYFQKSFGEAYMRQSRAKLQLRLSTFVNSRCLISSIDNNAFKKLFNTEEGSKEPATRMTVREYSAWFNGLVLNRDAIKRVQNKFMASKEVATYSYDPTVILIYDLLKDSAYTRAGLVSTTTKAFQEPSKKFEYTTMTDPIRILQYLYASKDFFLDGYKIQNINTFLSDVKKVKKLASHYSIVDSDTFEKSPYKRILMEHLTSAKGTGKPLLLKFNPENDLVNTVVKMLENHTSYTQYYKVEIGMVDELVSRSFEADKETGLYISGSSLTSDWHKRTPEILSDIALLMFLMKDEKPEDVIKAVRSMKTKAGDYTAIECLDDFVEMYSSGALKLTPLMEQVLCALDDFVLNSPVSLDGFIQQKLSYSYKYHQSKPKNGMTTVDLKFLGESFQLVFYETGGKPGHELTVTTASRRINIYGWAYLAGLRLAGVISVNKYVEMMSRHPTDSLPERKPIDLGGRYSEIYRNKSTGKLTVKQDVGVDYIVPIRLVDSINLSDDLQKEHTHQLPRFNLSHFSVYTGRSKVYTINPYALRQTNAWSSTIEVRGVPANVLLMSGNMHRLLVGEELRIHDLSGFKSNKIKETPTIHIRTKHQTTVLNDINQSLTTMRQKLIQGSPRFSELDFGGKSTQEMTVRERMNSVLANTPLSYQTPESFSQLPLKTFLTKETAAECIFLNTPSALLHGFDYDGEMFTYYQPPKDLDQDACYLHITGRADDTLEDEYVSNQIKDVESHISAFLAKNLPQMITSQDLPNVEDIDTGESKETTAGGTRIVYSLDPEALEDFNYLEKIGEGCESCVRCICLVDMEERNLGITAEELIEQLQEYSCPSCEYTIVEPDSPVESVVHDTDQVILDTTTHHYLEKEALEDFGFLVEIAPGCDFCSVCVIDGNCQELSMGVTLEELTESLEDYKCTGTHDNLSSVDTHSAAVTSDQNAPDSSQNSVLVKTKLGAITTDFDLLKVAFIILSVPTKSVKFFNFDIEVYDFFETFSDRFGKLIDISLIYPKEMFTKLLGQQYAKLERPGVSRAFPWMMQYGKLKSWIANQGDGFMQAEEFLKTAEHHTLMATLEEVYGNKSQIFGAVSEYVAEFDEKILLEEDEITHLAMNDDEDRDEEDDQHAMGIDTRDFVDTSDLGKKSVHIHPSEMHHVRNMPHTVHGAYENVRSLSVKIASGAMIGKCEFRKIDRNLRIHALYRISELSKVPDINCKIGDGLKVFLNAERKVLEYGRTIHASGAISLEMVTDDTIVYRKVSRISDMVLYKNLHKISTIKNCTVEPATYGEFHLHVPVNQKDIPQIQQECDKQLLSLLDPDALLYSHIAECLSQHEVSTLLDSIE